MASVVNNAGTQEGAPEAPTRKPSDFFAGSVPWALFALGATAVGFWRTFFSQLGNIDAVHMWHGASSTGWLVLVLVQATLISSRQYRLHRMIGWSSAVMFIILMVTSWIVLALMLSGKSGIPFEFAKLPAYTDVWALPLMVICYVGGIMRRKDKHIHSRLMAITLLAGLLPAVSRVFNLVWTGPEGLIIALTPSYLLLLVIIAFAIYIDWSKGRLRWPFPFAFAWIALSYVTLFPVGRSAAFDALARWIGATG